MEEILPMIKSMTIPHSAQRYDTVGDWWIPFPGRLEIRISALNNKDYEFLVLIHELVEAYLCKKHGVKEEDVTEFDVTYGENGGAGEPGDEPNAPYHNEHVCATKVEKYLADILGVGWEEYDKAVMTCGEGLPLGDSSSSE